jgi:hypothetical protein
LPDGIHKIPIWVYFGWPWNGKCWHVFIDIWSILGQFCTFYGPLVYFVVIWCILRRFGMLLQEKSGSPAWKGRRRSRLRTFLTDGLFVIIAEKRCFECDRRIEVNLKEEWHQGDQMVLF